MNRFGLLVALIALAAAALAVQAQATRPKPRTQVIEMVGQLTGPNSAAGTWTGIGLVDDAGTYTETFRFAGETIHARKVLIGEKGTIVLRVRTIVVWLNECTATFKGGSWRIVSGTGAYEHLKGGGAPATEPGSFGDVCTGAIEVTHAGKARDDSRTTKGV